MLAAVQKYKGVGVFCWGLPIGSRMSSSIVWAVDACQDVLEFYRILWQALVARQEAFIPPVFLHVLAAARTRAWLFRISCSRAPHYTCASMQKRETQ
jgi:hypothetical protein